LGDDLNVGSPIIPSTGRSPPLHLAPQPMRDPKRSVHDPLAVKAAVSDLAP